MKAKKTWVLSIPERIRLTYNLKGLRPTLFIVSDKNQRLLKTRCNNVVGGWGNVVVGGGGSNVVGGGGNVVGGATLLGGATLFLVVNSIV